MRSGSKRFRRRSGRTTSTGDRASICRITRPTRHGPATSRLRTSSRRLTRSSWTAARQTSPRRGRQTLGRKVGARRLPPMVRATSGAHGSIVSCTSTIAARPTWPSSTPWRCRSEMMRETCSITPRWTSRSAWRSRKASSCSFPFGQRRTAGLRRPMARRRWPPSSTRSSEGRTSSRRRPSIRTSRSERRSTTTRTSSNSASRRRSQQRKTQPMSKACRRPHSFSRLSG